MKTGVEVSDLKILSWPKCLFFHALVWKNPNELFDQPRKIIFNLFILRYIKKKIQFLLLRPSPPKNTFPFVNILLARTKEDCFVGLPVSQGILGN